MSEAEPAPAASTKQSYQEIGKFCTELKQILFISVDLAGSTEFKHRIALFELNKPPGAAPDEEDRCWLRITANFYKDFSDQLTRLAVSAKLRAPRQWKLIGDEIIFYVEVTNGRECARYITILRNLLIKLNQEDQKNRLGYKGAAWLAEIPSLNSAIPIEIAPFSLDSDAPQKFFGIDFIGPQIDRGFRVSKFSSIERLAVSIELALVLLKIGNHEDFEIHYDGRKEFKGILSNRDYPVFYVEAYVDPFLRAEEKVLQNGKHVPADMTDLCIKFLEINPNFHVPCFVSCDKLPATRVHLDEQIKRGQDRFNTIYAEFVQGVAEPRIIGPLAAETQLPDIAAPAGR